MGRTTGIVLVAAALVVAGAGAAAGASAAPRRYVVDQVRASWELPTQREGRSRMYWIEAARYEDLDSGEVRHFARAHSLACKSRGEGLSCSSDMGPWQHARGKPSEFSFSHDLSAASVAFEVRGVEHRAEWTPYEVAEEPFYFAPGTYERTEGCGNRSGKGYGVHRPMRATGSVFGRDLESDPARGIVGIARFYLETECDPGDWWRAGAPLPGSLPQWLRRAETSSFLSMLERPSMPTSFAFS